MINKALKDLGIEIIKEYQDTEFAPGSVITVYEIKINNSDYKISYNNKSKSYIMSDSKTTLVFGNKAAIIQMCKFVSKEKIK